MKKLKLGLLFCVCFSIFFIGCKNPSVSVEKVETPSPEEEIIAPTITISTTSSETVEINSSVVLTANASLGENDTGTLSYQWYTSTVASGINESKITSATSNSYSVPTTTAGTKYYFCITTSSTKTTLTAKSNIIKVTVSPTDSDFGFDFK